MKNGIAKCKCSQQNLKIVNKHRAKLRRVNTTKQNRKVQKEGNDRKKDRKTEMTLRGLF